MQTQLRRRAEKIIATLTMALLLCVVSTGAMAGWNTAPEIIGQGTNAHPTWIYTPSSAMPNGERILLIALHGCDQSHDKIKEFGNLVPTAEANGIVVAVPSVGAEASGPGCWDYHLAKDRREHIAELISLANNLKTRAALNIDPNHVYIVGLSSGAAMALDVGCAAPDVFAGMGAIAGPSVGSDQDNKALADASLIPRTNVDNAIENCRLLAGNKESDFATQITSITFGDMDKNTPNKQFDFSLFDDAFNRAHAGQLALVSKKWSDENVEVMQKIYGTGSLGLKEAVQNGLGTQQEAEKDDKARISLLVVHNVGHAWPAGSGLPNSASRGGLWMAQSGLNYPEYIADWFIEHNLRVGNPEVIANAEVDGTTVSVSGTVKDPDGSITSVDTALLKADAEGLFQQIDEHGGISFNSADGSYSDRYNGLNDGFYKAQVTATDNATRTATRVTREVKVGNPDPLHPCQDFTDNNFNHVQQSRALQCNFGFTCAKGSGDNLGLFNTFITTTVAEVQPGFFREGACPR